MIRAALGEEDQVDSMDAYAFGQAQTAMLLALVQEAGTTDQQTQALLEETAQQVRSFFERQAKQ